MVTVHACQALRGLTGHDEGMRPARLRKKPTPANGNVLSHLALSHSRSYPQTVLSFVESVREGCNLTRVDLHFGKNVPLSKYTTTLSA